LGTLQVVRDGETVAESEWRTRQARQLLKILITERPRPVATDRLIDLLWPDSALGAAATTLRSAINALRNVLEPERPNRAPSSYIHTQAPGYAFRRNPDIWLDVDEYEAALNLAERASDADEKRRHLENAIDLYRDDYLISDPYADWAKAERERLRERYFHALLALAELKAQAGDYADAISMCRRVLARDEVRENAYQALMRYQAESGDSAAALLTYERCRSILAEELGADPSPITQKLHQRILNGEIEVQQVAKLATRSGVKSASAHTSDEMHPEESSLLPQHTLLPTVRETFPELFVGRKRELSMLEDALKSTLEGEGVVVVLAGETGVGKTCLASHILQEAGELGATVISAACQRLERQLPYAPLADGIGRYLQVLPDSSLRRLPQAPLTHLAQIIPGIQDRLIPQDTKTVNQLSPEENRQRLIDGIVAFLTGLARLRPLVLFLDDVHWADVDTLAVLSRLSKHIPEQPIFLLLAYHQGDLIDNENLMTLVRSLQRRPRYLAIDLKRLDLSQVRAFVQSITGPLDEDGAELATALYEVTLGNALFLTEALKSLQERLQDHPSSGDLLTTWHIADQQFFNLGRSQRIKEIIRERIDRLPADARTVLQLAAVIGRDFSLELLELAAPSDPISGLEILLQRQLLIERLDERLDFNHHVVRQIAYDSMSALLRRRLHRRVADALVQLRPSQENPAEIAFHYSQAGSSARLLLAKYSILAGEKLIKAYAFSQAIRHFDDALAALEDLPDSPTDLVRKALQGRGIAYENLLDPDGVTETYSRLRRWALKHGDSTLALMAHARLTALLGVVGQQRESNNMLPDLLAEAAKVAVPALADLIERRRLIHSTDNESDYTTWAHLSPPPPIPGDPVYDITKAMEPVYAALPLLEYGWTLRVQGQFHEAIRCLESAANLSQETAQRSIASIAYHQLAVATRIQGDVEQSRKLNEISKTLNRQVHGSSAELASLWPRISSAYRALQTDELDKAEGRLQRVLHFLDNRGSFRTHRNSALIGLGLVRLRQGSIQTAQRLLSEGLADAENLYPYTYVQGMLGLAHIARRQGDLEASARLLRASLHFAGRRSLVEEFVEAVLAIAYLRPPGAPVAELLNEALEHAKRYGLRGAIPRLEAAIQGPYIAKAVF
jgi:DNA-binding SARP family transcriptional activator